MQRKQKEQKYGTMMMTGVRASQGTVKEESWSSWFQIKVEACLIIKLPALPNKHRGYLVRVEFQMNNEKHLV